MVQVSCYFDASYYAFLANGLFLPAFFIFNVFICGRTKQVELLLYLLSSQCSDISLSLF